MVASDAAEQYEGGRSAFLSGDYARAVERLEAAIAADPEQLGYRLLLARAYDLNGQVDRSDIMLLQILERQPAHREAAVALARRCFRRGEYARVVKILEVLRPSSNDYEVYHLLGSAFYHEGGFEKARRNLSRATGCDEAQPEDHRRLGEVYLAQERFALAAEALERAGQQGLDDADFHLNLARAYFHLGKHLGEVERRTVKGGVPGRIYENGYLLSALPGNSDEFSVCPPRSAVFHARRALDLGLEAHDARLLLGEIWLGARYYDRAVAEYRSAESHVPAARRASYYYNFARASLGIGDPGAYLLRLQSAAELDASTYGPLLYPGHLAAADLYIQNGDLQKYIETLRVAVERWPSSCDLHYRLGNALWERGDHAAAVRQWRITLELRDDHPDRSRMLQLIQTTEAQKGE